jgi:hypothetical protein
MRTALLLTATWLGLLAIATGAPTDSFDRYQVIVERKPFGEPPPPPVTPPPPVEETPPWAESYRLCSVYEAEGSKTRVGLLEMKSNKALILAIGESQNGILLLSADVAEETATLSKDGQEVTMKLEASKRKAPAKPAPRPTTRSRVTPPKTPPKAPVRSTRGVIRTRR